uniref:Suppressor of cytokine signaling 3 n=4 Tax=Canis lupus TaxID=9612 RepID=A0A8C0PYE4_CANLF
MEAGDPRFPEDPGLGPRAPRVPSPLPPPPCLGLLAPSPPPGAPGLSGAPSAPGVPLPLPTAATRPETQVPRPSFPLGVPPARAGEGAAWGRPAGGGGGVPGWEGGRARGAGAGVPRPLGGGRAGRAGGLRHSRGAPLPPRSPPGCGSGRCAEAAEQLQPPPRRPTLAPCAMVTHSKFPAAGMSRPLDTSLRLKTFSSKSEYQLVVNAVRKLQESGFYWSAVTGGEANLLLSAEPAGTFLIRDSSDQRHFFTLSVKTQSGTKNLRIQCEGGSFSLQSDPRSTQPVPRFDCVLKLVHHYMPPPGAPSFPAPPTEPSSEVSEQPPSQPLPGNPPRRAYYIYSGGEKIPLVLSRPLSSNVATLQHLCRKTVNGHLDSYEKVTQLPGPIREFLDQYDAPL